MALSITLLCCICQHIKRTLRVADLCFLMVRRIPLWILNWVQYENALFTCGHYFSILHLLCIKITCVSMKFGCTIIDEYNVLYFKPSANIRLWKRDAWLKMSSVSCLIYFVLGRLSFFTSGSENPHFVEKVKSGTRYALTVSFTCDPSKAIGDPQLKES